MILLLTTNGGRNQFGLAIDNATANPHLDTDTTISGMGLRIRVVNICPEGMQRSTPLFEVLAACNFCTANATRDRDLDALGASTHGGGNSILDSTAILNTTLNLLGDVLCHKHSIHLRTLHFADVNLDILAGQFLELLTEFVDLGACTTNNQTRTGSINRDGEEFEGSLNIDFRDTGFRQASVEVLANLIILNKLLLKLSSTEPARIPSADNT